MSFGGGGGGSSSIQGATDVFLSSPSNGQVLSYNSGTLKWVNAGLTTSDVGGLEGALDGKASTATTAVAVQWTGSAWPTYSTDPDRIRHFYSQDDENATTPTGYSAHDVWFAHPEGN